MKIMKTIGRITMIIWITMKIIRIKMAIMNTIIKSMIMRMNIMQVMKMTRILMKYANENYNYGNENQDYD